MIGNAIRLAAAGILATIAMASQSPAPAAPAAGTSITQGRLGNIFFDGDPIVLPVQAPGQETATWTLDDGWGDRIRSGSLKLDSGEGALKLSSLPHGLFRVTVSAAGQAPAAMSLAVMSPYDVRKAGDTPFGAMTHMAQGWDPDLLEPLARAGVKNIRDEVYWSNIELRKGEFAFPQRYDRYRAAAAGLGLVPLTPLTFNNRLYDNVPSLPDWRTAPWTQSGMDGYAHYASAVLGHYPGEIHAVEVWNEYNGGFALGPADGRPAVYRTMLKRAYAAVKAQDPHVTVLAGGTIGVPIGWLRAVLEDGGIDACDGVSVHPYGYLYRPESLAGELENLRSLIRSLNNGRDKPIWVTEQGYFTIAPGEYGNRNPVTEQDKANQLVRAWVLFLAHGVQKAFWYLARDDGTFGTMGLVGAPDNPEGRYAPKPPIVAYATLIRALTGAQYARQDTDLSPDAYSFVFREPSGPVRVMWATKPVDAALDSALPLDVIDMQGVDHRVYPVAGKVHLHLSEAPLIVRGAAGRIAEEPDRVAVPAASAAGSDAAVSLALAGLGASRASAGVLEAAAQNGRARWSVPAAGDGGERWVPLEAFDGTRSVYYGVARMLLVAPLRIGLFPRLDADGMVHLDVINADVRRAYHLTRVEWTAGGASGSRALDILAAPGSTTTIDAPIKKPEPMAIAAFHASISVDAAAPLTLDATVSDCRLMRREIVADGDLSDWAGVPAIDLSKCPYQKLLADRSGDADLSGAVQFAWNDKNLFVAADIIDDVFDQSHTGYDTWKGDNIQLGVSTLAPWTGGDWPAPNQEIGLSLTANGPELYRYGGQGLSGPLQSGKLVVRRAGTHTIYEAAIPWSELSPAGRPSQIGLGIFVNDADGAGRKGYLQWADIKRLDKMQPASLVETLR